MLLEDVQEHTEPVAAIAQKAQVREGPLRGSHLVLLLGKLIGCKETEHNDQAGSRKRSTLELNVEC